MSDENWEVQFEGDPETQVRILRAGVAGLRHELAAVKDERRMSLDALERSADALMVLKALVKANPDELPADLSKALNIVNDGYDQAVTTLAALGRRKQLDDA